MGRPRGPEPRGSGQERREEEHILVEADGGPLSAVVAGANVRDDKLLAARLDAIVVERPPAPPDEAPQHLCLDKGYDNEPSREVVRE